MKRQGELMYWPKDKPIPDGWELADDFKDIHHGYYSILIIKKDGGHAGPMDQAQE